MVRENEQPFKKKLVRMVFAATAYIKDTGNSGNHPPYPHAKRAWTTNADSLWRTMSLVRPMVQVRLAGISPISAESKRRTVIISYK